MSARADLPVEAAPGDRPSWPSRRFAEWPQHDRLAWLAETASGDAFADTDRPVLTLADASIEKFRKGYGRWLGFLAMHGWLEPDQLPEDRPSAQRLSAYFQALRAVGNSDYTIIGRFSELAAALSILALGRYWRWVRSPGGRSIASRLQRQKRHIVVPHSRVLYKWSCKMMDTAMNQVSDLKQALQFRDGLIIALEAARARRLRSMAGLQVGSELARQPDGRWRITLGPKRVKTGNADSFPFHADLSPYFDYYLGHVRPFLLRGRASTAMWIGLSGQDLSQKSYGENYGLRAKRRFGVRFGPHRSRHAAATSAVMDVPSDPTLAVRMLRIGADVMGKHYDRAEQVQASQSYDIMITCKQAEAIARMGYRRRGGRTEDSSGGAA